MGATARLRGSRGAPSTIHTRRLDDPRRRDQAPPFGVVVPHGKRPVLGGAARLRLRDRPEAEVVPGRSSSALRPAPVQAPPRGRQGGEGGQYEGPREKDGARLESYIYLHFVVQPNYRTERHTRRCPSLRGPTSSR